MKKLTETGKVLAGTSPDEIKLDRQVKKVLSCKPILSRILAEVVEECKGMSYDEIEECIEGEALVDEVPVEPGYSNITGNAQEDYANREGMIRYDLRTYLRFPDKAKPQLVKILIDVEAQKEEEPGYDIPLRALFYCARMVSAQLSTEFSVKSDDPVKYGNLKKVYSIWILTETSKKRANSIERYHITRDMLYGSNEDSPRYDLMSAIIINLSKKHDCSNADNEMIRFLTDLFDNNMSADTKIDILENKYGCHLTDNVKEEVVEMCKYTVSVKEEGIAQGRAEGRAQIIEGLLRDGKTAEEINDFIKIPMEEIKAVEESLLVAAK